MHLRNHENFYEMKHKNFTLGGFCLGGFCPGGCRGFLSGGFCPGTDTKIVQIIDFEYANKHYNTREKHFVISSEDFPRDKQLS